MRELPQTGPFFPYLIKVREADRATEFRQRCQGLGIHGVTLHSYRYAWAQRAKKCGYPERYAQEALGHNSKAIHRAYASGGEVIIPALEDFEKNHTATIIPFRADEQEIATGKTSGLIVAAVAHADNVYDGHTLPEVLQQTEVLTGSLPTVAIVDRGYRGTKRIGNTEILVPDAKPKDQSPQHKRAMQKRFRRRCAIEPTIGHLKSDYSLARNYLKGFLGDSINLLLAAAAWNFNKWLRKAVALYLQLIQSLCFPRPIPVLSPVSS